MSRPGKENEPLNEVVREFSDKNAGTTRREFLRRGILFSISAGSVAGGVVNIVRLFPVAGEITKEVDETYPLDDAKAQKAEKTKEKDALESQVTDELKKGDYEGVKKTVSSDEFTNTYRGYVQAQAEYNVQLSKNSDLYGQIMEERSPLYKTLGNFAIAGVGLMFSINTWLGLADFVNKRVRSQKRFLNSMFSIYPEWSTDPPQAETVNSLLTAISYLPPVGGKFDTSQNGPLQGKMSPVLTAEEHAQEVIKKRGGLNIGQEYIYQISVQGRLPDRFKYAAVAMVLANPYRNEFDKTFFKADWGQVAPLIHDGGMFENDVLPGWRNVKGRTDFIQKIPTIWKADIDKLLDLIPNELLSLPTEVIQLARAEQMVREHIKGSAAFYQRAALALHAHEDTIPEGLPDNIKEDLKRIWIDYEVEMRRLLNSYDLQGAVDIEWFLKQPRQLWGFRKRHEADWSPIQQELIGLEDARWKQPEIREKTTMLMRRTVSQADYAIGLISNNN